MKSIPTGKILNVMYDEGRKRGAPVFTIGKLVRENPYRSLIFTILSARTKDANTIKVCTKLFKQYPTFQKLAKADRKKVEKLIYGIGFYKQKSKYITNAAKMVVKDFNGKLPGDIEDLVKLPGVGRKVANILLIHVHRKDSIAVDVHVHRISNRLGIVNTKKPEQTEKELKKKIPKKLWTKVNTSMVAYGQTLCLPRNPMCDICRVKKYCRYYAKSV